MCYSLYPYPMYSFHNPTVSDLLHIYTLSSWATYLERNKIWEPSVIPNINLPPIPNDPSHALIPLAAKILRHA